MKDVSVEVMYTGAVMLVAVCTFAPLSFQFRLRSVATLLFGTAPPKHFIVYLIVLGAAISIFGVKVTAVKELKDKVFQDLDSDIVLLMVS